jgi:hypothetical protein
MGDRISIQFQTGQERSVTLFSHWGGETMPRYVRQFDAEVLKKCRGDSYPLDRMEPNTVMVAFIAWLFRGAEKDEVPTHGYYLGVTRSDGDNSDNGNYVYTCALDKGIIARAHETEDWTTHVWTAEDTPEAMDTRREST